MSDAKGDQPQGPKFDPEELRRMLMASEEAGVPVAPSDAKSPRFILKSNEELRLLTAQDLVKNGKYDSVEEAMEDLKKFGF